MTVHERVAAARARLLAAGLDRAEADLDARLLAQSILGWDVVSYFVAGHEQEPAGFDVRYEALVSKRAAREPLAYVRGFQQFWGRSFEVSPAVLIPRPETEGIIEVALELTASCQGLVRMADVGTGSGCLAVTLAVERPSARVTATDISSDALAVARRNAAKHLVAGRVQFVLTDLLSGVEGAFDLIVTNPPYVPERDRATLQPEVRDYEPPGALFAGETGLDAIESLLGRATSHLRPGGHLIFEFGYGQAEAIRARIARTKGLDLVEIRNDLQQIPRIAVARAGIDAEDR